ncbi:pseudouridine synthase [uncultured Clostridium sp.]|uniref:pseudouridine synthase n=1 Tax=uncultured Clostridium sp. TaxID=59620 RepID=UPI0025FC204E|nr:pseudouridine synthase [uncultured Clostridium sp.]
MRINKLFSNLGICSRKETCRLIEEKRIKVNGEYCIQGQWVTEEDEILFDGELVKKMQKVYLAFNKPKGITCTLEKSAEHNIGEYLNYPQYVFPVGRLDKDSEGLIILTNDGEFSNLILECENMHEKEYIVKVDKDYDDSFLEAMAEGVEISAKGGSGVKRISDTEGIIVKDGEEQTVMLYEVNSGEYKKNIIKTRPCYVERIDGSTFKIILTQGLNRQIRKMCSVLGYKVISLKRIRIMNVYLDKLNTGEYREISKEHIEEIMKLNDRST